MQQFKILRPRYAESFRCIGSACEDTCCHGWSVPLDPATFEKYRQLPASPLRTLIDANIVLAPEGAKSSDGYGPDLFAKIRMNEANQCPLLTEDRLCRIHAECGEELLSQTCAAYPRIVYAAGGHKEHALAFSCPEAVRHVLLKPVDLIEEALPDDVAGLPPFYAEIRNTVLKLVRNRAYPLWQRVFQLGLLCHRLDAIAAGEIKRDVPMFLANFERSISTGRLRKAMEAQPVDRRSQLDAVLRLAGLLLNKSNVTARFVECINTFATGIGNGPGATLESLTGHFTTAHDRYFAPFFARNPQILENYLINTILRSQFPFGREAKKEGAEAGKMSREFVMLSAQFALTKGLLIGVAGFHREAFSTAHVVHTVQAASKHFDHYPDFPRMAFELLVESRLDGARGMSIMLRNADPKVAAQATNRPPSPRLREPLRGVAAAD